MKNYLKKLLKSKTMIFSILLAILGVIEMNMSVFSNYMTEETYGLFVIFIGVVTAVLRILTTTSISDK